MSPVLANLFMHYAFDSWLEREFPAVEFERFADDAVVHCATERQALQVRAALSERLEEVGLRLHPDKTKVVYCKDRKRRRDYECTSFTFLGYTFRVRKAPTGDGKEHVRSVPPGDQRGRPERQRSHYSRVADQPAYHLGPCGACRVAESGHPWLDELLRKVLPDRDVRSPAPHKHLHCAVGAEEVQAVEGVQASKSWWNGLRKESRNVRPLGVDARVLTDWMRRAV